MLPRASKAVCGKPLACFVHAHPPHRRRTAARLGQGEAMGFYLRKSIRVGPFRFNLSGSGVSVSAGVRGLRVGTGPRGNYVHMGLGGVYYRATVPRVAHSTIRASLPRPGVARVRAPAVPVLEPAIPAGTHGPMVDIDSIAAAEIVDSSSAELLAEMSAKKKKIRLWPFAAAAALGTVAYAATLPWSPWPPVVAAVLGAVAIAFAYRRDVLAKTVVLFYGMEPELEKGYGLLHEWAAQLAGCARVWHIQAHAQVRDRKYHAGANQLLRRKTTSIRKAEPPYLKTNVETVAIDVGSQVLHFFPDRVLIYDAQGVGAVGYRELGLSVQGSRFIESEAVPSDATVVDRTWAYVNKNGGPDRRFKNNRSLPVCAYDELTIRSASGINEVIQLSRNGVAQGVRRGRQRVGAEVAALEAVAS